MKTHLARVAIAPILLGALTWTHSVMPARPAIDTQEQTWNAPAVRTAMEARYRTWGDARIDYDKEALQAMAADDFYIQLIDRKITGEEFINQVSRKNPVAPLTRFDVEILSVQKDGDDWKLVICEKLEWTMTGPEGQTRKAYSLWVTRDGWRRVDDDWRVTYSEEIGHEEWIEREPPFEDW